MNLPMWTDFCAYLNRKRRTDYSFNLSKFSLLHILIQLSLSFVLCTYGTHFDPSYLHFMCEFRYYMKDLLPNKPVWKQFLTKTEVYEKKQKYAAENQGLLLQILISKIRLTFKKHICTF